METSNVFVFFIFFSVVASLDSCSDSTCGNNEATVHFPFRLVGDNQERCSYRGFDLFCNKKNKTVIEFKSWGKLFVRDINYVAQELQVYDQHNCLPNRLLNLNLSGTPFKGTFYQTFDFFNCSANFTLEFLEPISCLSTSNYSIFATSSVNRIRYMLTVCQLFASVDVPTRWPVYNRRYSADITDVLQVTWDIPGCQGCVASGGKCGFENSSSDEIGCFDLPRPGLSRAMKYILTIGVGIPTLLCIFLLALYICGMFKFHVTNLHHHHHHHSSRHTEPPADIFTMGLDESVIQSFPETILGESRRLVKPDDVTCPICLSEYRPKETLRTIPACKHCFHASCIDEWLRRNITCPLCRTSPSNMSPLA